MLFYVSSFVIYFICYIVYLFLCLLWSCEIKLVKETNSHIILTWLWVQLPIYHVTGGNLSAVSQDSNRPPFPLFLAARQTSQFSKTWINLCYKCQMSIDVILSRGAGVCSLTFWLLSLIQYQLSVFHKPLWGKGGLCSVEMAFLIGFHDPGGTDSVIVWI